MTPCSLIVLSKIVTPNWQWCRVLAKMVFWVSLRLWIHFKLMTAKLHTEKPAFFVFNVSSLVRGRTGGWGLSWVSGSWFASLGPSWNSDQVSSFQFESYMKVQQHFVQRRKRFSKSRLPPPPEIFITYFLTRGRCNSITRIMHKVMCWKSAQDWRHHLWSRQPMFELTNEPI